MTRMLFKLISCNVFEREVCWCVARTPHLIDPEFIELGEHARSESLRKTIQGKIDAADASGRNYDAILILFGICGNAGIGLSAGKIKLVLPRAHDCATVLLGSRQKFQEHFQANPSTPFSSSGYFERGEYFLRTGEGDAAIHYGDAYAEFVERYGPENAAYIWEQLHPPAAQNPDEDRAVFIDLPQTAHLGYAEEFRKKVEAAGKRYERLEGSVRLIEALLGGRWDEGDFLIVPPGQKTAGVYDWQEIIRAKAP